ncbi:MAG: TonB-dependent receptor [Pseudomonadota bacterium]|nr:TonB-dependent receptor [Pseudomonadota bacterium]
MTMQPRLPSLFARNALSGAILGALAGLAQPALAQTTATPVVVTRPAPPPKQEVKPTPAPVLAPEAGVDATVTVTAERPTNRIDRQVYDVKSDVSASNSSAADALNNVPSVAVDPDGTVTLRGSTKVQIYIDGKPSAMMQGDNRGATLNALPAEDIESVEVINNPGAQFGNEGGGGPILNLVMRRNRKPGGFGALIANGGTAGRYNSAASGSYNTGRFGVQGSVNVRHDGRDSTADVERVRVDPVTGIASRSAQQSISNGLRDSAGFNAAANYNLGDKDTLGANLAYSRLSNDGHANSRYVDFGQDAIADSDYVRTTRSSGQSDSYTWGARYDHKGAISGEVAKLDLRVSSATNDSGSAFSNLYTIRPPFGFDNQSRQQNVTGTKIIDFTGDYELPVDQAMFKTGYKIASHKNSFDTRYTNIDMTTLAETPNAARSNRFELDETTVALYGSYQWRLNERWTALAGMRTEFTKMDFSQLNGAPDASNRYANLIPSAFATYRLSELTNIRLSYAHRIRRPGAGDLNPFVVYRDEFNVSSGNPNLRPTNSDSLELGYETRFGKLDTNLRGYYRKDTGLISDRKVFISDTVILTTKNNAGSNQSGGLEFTVSGKILPNLSINTSGNLSYSEQQIFGVLPSDVSTRHAIALSGRARFNYHLSDEDQVQVSLNAQGKSLNGQGYRQPNTTTNFSVRHALTPALSMVLNVTDVFNANKIETITDTELLKETSIRRSAGRIVYLGLMYRFGGAAGGRPGEGGRRGGGGGGNRPEGPPRT